MPIIVLSAIGDEDEKVRALEAGADDYVVKPFGPRELVARLQAALRRAGGDPDEPAVRVDGLEVDLAARRVLVDGAEVHLTPTEFELLRTLCAPPRPAAHPPPAAASVWGARTRRTSRSSASTSPTCAARSALGTSTDPGRGVPVQRPRAGSRRQAARGRLLRRFLELLRAGGSCSGITRAVARRVEHVLLEPRVAARRAPSAPPRTAPSSSLAHSSSKSASARRRAWRAEQVGQLERLLARARAARPSVSA